MYLRIPEETEQSTMEKIYNLRNQTRRKICHSYDSLNGITRYSPLSPYIKGTAGTIEEHKCKAFSRTYDASRRKMACEINDYPIGDMYFEACLVGDAQEVLEKGTLVEELDTGEKVINYGKTFLHTEELKDLEIFNFTNSEDFVSTGETFTIAVDPSGNTVNANILTNNKNGKRFIALKADSTGMFTNAEPAEITMENIKAENIIICEETPLRWLVDGNKAMTIDSPLIAVPSADNNTAYIGELLNSPEYQKSAGLEPTLEKPKAPNPFKVGDLTLDQQIKRALRIGVIPFLVGPPGIGKTEIIESQSKHVKTYIMSTWSPTSFTGKDYVIPADQVKTIDGNGTERTHTERALTGRSKPEWLIDIEHELELAKEDGEDVILFLDEFDKLTPDLQVFVNGIISNKPTLGGWPVPEGVKIVLAGNTTIDSLASNKISSEVSSRLMTMKVKVNVEEWLRWAIKNDVDPLVIAYIKVNKTDLLTVEKGPDGRVDAEISMNPRKWVKMVSKGIKESRVTCEPLMINNYMTPEQVQKFMNFLDEYYNNRIDDLLQGTAPLYFTEDVGRNSFVLSVLSTIAKVENLKNILPYIKNKEYRVFFVKNWLAYHPDQKTEVYEILKEIEVEEEALGNGPKI